MKSSISKIDMQLVKTGKCDSGNIKKISQSRNRKYKKPS